MRPFSEQKRQGWLAGWHFGVSGGVLASPPASGSVEFDGCFLLGYEKGKEMRRAAENLASAIAQEVDDE